MEAGLTYGEAEICNVQSQGFSAEKTGEGKWHIAITDKAVYQEAGKNGLAVTVTCTTKYDTCVSEILQIYVHVNGTDNEVPNIRLAAFGRMKVLPGKETVKTFAIPAKAFMTVDSEGMRIADGDGADIYIGFSSEK